MKTCLIFGRYEELYKRCWTWEVIGYGVHWVWYCMFRSFENMNMGKYGTRIERQLVFTAVR